ncbi:hypothetical protein Tco_0457405, partial [Tanacetum coccineum]
GLNDLEIVYKMTPHQKSLQPFRWHNNILKKNNSPKVGCIYARRLIDDLLFLRGDKLLLSEYHKNSDGNSKYDRCLPVSLLAL